MTPTPCTRREGDGEVMRRGEKVTVRGVHKRIEGDADVTRRGSR